jgi:hypothetical protein
MSTLPNKIAIVLGSAMFTALSIITIGYLENKIYEEGLFAGLEQGELAGIQKGKEAKILELAKVFAPHGYEKIKAAKRDCEVKTSEVCQIYGGFAPKSLFLPKAIPDTSKKGPY